jgi:hypothetical protein
MTVTLPARALRFLYTHSDIHLNVEFRDLSSSQWDMSGKVASGTWNDPYSGLTFTDPDDVDVDHMVPLRNAHVSGAWAWSFERRQEYANDLSHPEHLIAVDDATNQAKGAKGPDEWLPPRTEYHCQYVKDWEAIKTRWELTMTTAERVKVEEIKAECP